MRVLRVNLVKENSMSDPISVKLKQNETMDSCGDGQQCSSASDDCEKIREAAYQKWEAAGSPSGDGVEFWLAAEGELTSGVRPKPR
jgi:hypothetical protein